MDEDVFTVVLRVRSPDPQDVESISQYLGALSDDVEVLEVHAGYLPQPQED